MSRPFVTVAVANFLYFLNFAFFFLMPVWVLQHGGGEETAGRVVGVGGIAGLVALPFIGWFLVLPWGVASGIGALAHAAVTRKRPEGLGNEESGIRNRNLE